MMKLSLYVNEVTNTWPHTYLDFPTVAFLLELVCWDLVVRRLSSWLLCLPDRLSLLSPVWSSDVSITTAASLCARFLVLCFACLDCGLWDFLALCSSTFVCTILSLIVLTWDADLECLGVIWLAAAWMEDGCWQCGIMSPAGWESLADLEDRLHKKITSKST